MRRILKGLIGLVIVLALLWLGLWFYAEMRLKQLVTAQIDQINTAGTVQISYDRLTSSRSPLVASVTLVNPRWSETPAPGAGPLSLHAASFGAHIDLLRPLTLHIDVPHSLDISTPRASGALTFAVAQMTERLNPGVWLGHTDNPVRAGDARFAGINLLASNGSLQVASIDSLVLHQALDATASKGQTALAATLQMRGFALSPILARLINLPFDGKLAGLDLSVQLSGPLDWQSLARQEAALPDETARHKFIMQALHQWAMAGGIATGKAHLALGPSQLDAAGHTVFDANGQPSGTSSLKADHLDALSAALTKSYPFLQGWVAQAQARFSPYISSNAQDGQVLAVQTRFGKDGVFINGTRTGDMPPLDWDKLLNPPPPAPPPATAPGDGSGAVSP